MLKKRSVVDLHCCWSVNYTWCQHLIIYFLCCNSRDEHVRNCTAFSNSNVESWREMLMSRFDTAGITLWHLCCMQASHKDTQSVRKHDTIFYRNFMYDTNKQMNCLMRVLTSWERKTAIVHCYHDSGQICTCSNNRAPKGQIRGLINFQRTQWPRCFEMTRSIKQKDAVSRIPQKANHESSSHFRCIIARICTFRYFGGKIVKINKYNYIHTKTIT